MFEKLSKIFRRIYVLKYNTVPYTVVVIKDDDYSIISGYVQ
jgi:hypothetical protein